MKYTYQIALGFIVLFSSLVYAAPPPNDNFADAITLPGQNGTVETDVTEATGEPDEIVHSGVINSIWYTWQAPEDGNYEFEFTQKDYGTALRIYSGTGFNDLTKIAESTTLGLSFSPLTFYTTAGESFYIAVDGARDFVGTATLAYSRGSDFFVKDIHFNEFGTEFTSSFNLNGRLLFGVGFNFPELWTSDGTPEGTVLLKVFRDVFDTTCCLNGHWVSSFVNFKGKTLFRVWDKLYGIEIWQTDGTQAGTQLFKDIRVGPAGSNPSWITKVNGNLFFTASDGIHGKELWKTDGTAVGTELVKDINPVGSSSPLWLTNVNGTLYFKAFHPDYGEELWKSDGTEAGTTLVKDLLPGPTGDSKLGSLTKVNDLLFFTADKTPGVGIRELWVSDGTETGTKVIKDIRPGSDPNVLNLTNVNGTLFFSAHNDDNGTELWKSDGTELGTVLVKDINPGLNSSAPNDLININGTLFFSPWAEPVNGPELWKSDGTEAGTVLVKNINPSTSIDLLTFPRPQTNVNGMLYFSADDGVHGREFWKSDGTEAGTVLLEDIQQGPEGSNPFSLAHVDGQLFFRATAKFGTELYRDNEVIHNFADVPPGSFGFQFIEDFFGAQVTGGCGGDNYCPNDSVTRAQMAVFLEKAARGAAFTPPAATGVFNDVPVSNPFAPWIEQLATDGITGGCGTNLYCPNDTVTRAQMAVFIEKALRGSNFTPPPATGNFNDVPLSDPFAPWIEQLANDNITGGCGGGNYCPNNPVTRAQMAIFMVKAFDL